MLELEGTAETSSYPILSFYKSREVLDYEFKTSLGCIVRLAHTERKKERKKERKQERKEGRKERKKGLI